MTTQQIKPLKIWQTNRKYGAHGLLLCCFAARTEWISFNLICISNNLRRIFLPKHIMRSYIKSVVITVTCNFSLLFLHTHTHTRTPDIAVIIKIFYGEIKIAKNETFTIIRNECHKIPIHIFYLSVCVYVTQCSCLYAVSADKGCIIMGIFAFEFRWLLRSFCALFFMQMRESQRNEQEIAQILQ